MSSLRNAYYKQIQDDGKYFTRPITSTGIIGGVENMNVNGSVTPVEFWLSPDDGQVFTIKEFNLVISDAGSPAWNGYGSVVGPLTNGVQLFHEVNGVKTLLPILLKTNVDAARHSSDFDIFSLDAPNRVIIYRDTSTDQVDVITLKSSTNDRFGVVIQDDLTGLQVHEGQCMGRRIVENF